MSADDLPQRARPSRVRSGRVWEFTEILFGREFVERKKGNNDMEQS